MGHSDEFGDIARALCAGAVRSTVAGSVPERIGNGEEVSHSSDAKLGQCLRRPGFADPAEELAKAQLASRMQDIITRRRLTLVAAADLMSIGQPEVPALLDRRLANFSSARLMRLLLALGHNHVAGPERFT